MGAAQRPGPEGTGLRPHHNLNDGTLMRQPGVPPRTHVPTLRKHPPHRQPFPRLHRGSHGDWVKRLQTLLNQRLVPSPHLKVNGVFDRPTYAAVRVFQRGRKITVDGIVGPEETWPHLLGGRTVERGALPVKGLPDASPAPQAKTAPKEIVIHTLWEMSFETKMKLVVQRVPHRLPQNALQDLKGLTQLETLVPMLALIGMVGALTGSLAVVMGLVVAGTPILISLISCVHTTALAATSAELDDAADDLAQAIITGGVAAFAAVVGRVYARVKASAGKVSPLDDVPPAKVRPKPSSPPLPTSATPETPTLLRLRRLSLEELAREIRRITGDQKLLQWRQVEYGEVFEIVRAGPEAAAKLGVRPGDVIGYHQTTSAPMGFGGITGLDGLAPEEFSPYGDPFEGYGPATAQEAASPVPAAH